MSPQGRQNWREIKIICVSLRKMIEDIVHYAVKVDPGPGITGVFPVLYRLCRE